MGQTGFFHHIGSFFLLAATVLLIVTSISAPVVHSLSVLKVILPQNNNQYNPDITFGTFGYCVQASGSDDNCSKSHVGYNAADVLSSASGGQFDTGNYAADTANALTRVMVLHPVAAGLSFISFLLALGAGIVGSFLAALVSLLTFVVTLVVLITDFVGFAILKNAVNSSNTGATSEFGACMWTLLVAAICNLLATIILFFTCCSARLHKKRRSGKVERYDSPTTHSSRRRWF
ncbi:putative SUR7/PalI family-domain-containing protein [Seiridium cardinale]|uniref:SUR7/PalI family-domain-containing protein n=1 Tax=Seiridium cardinale TaxID=138064 RepID=A0ABR2Y6R1_9PEZI